MAVEEGESAGVPLVGEEAAGGEGGLVMVGVVEDEGYDLVGEMDRLVGPCLRTRRRCVYCGIVVSQSLFSTLACPLHFIQVLGHR